MNRLLPDPTALLEVYDKLKTVPNLFSGRGGISPDVLGQLLDPTSLRWTVDDVGMLCLVRHNDTSAHVHITFWDKRLRGREDLCRRFALRQLDEQGLTTLFTPIPEDNRTVTAFALRIGFRRLVKIKHVILYQATAEDLHRVNPDRS